MKGVDVFCRLAEANPDLDFGWTGWTGGAMRPPGTLRREYDPLERRLRSGSITIHGGGDWRDEDFLKTVATYDVLLTCGRSDSNPSTILEATAWGLVPVAPLQCGYYGDDWLTNIPLDDTEGASRILRELNDAPDDALEARRQAGFQRLESHYTWDHAARQVIDCIKAPTPMAPGETAWLERKANNQAKLRAIVRRYRREAAVESLFHGLAGRLKREPRPA
jgi:glycosyltransferase involved in cell wall biosynthesis